MWSTLIAGISLLAVFYAPLVLAEELKFLVGPVYLDRPGKVGVAVEFPLDVTPKRYDFQLIVGDKAVDTATEILTFQESKQGLDIILSVDVSGSMKGDPLSDAKDGLRSFLEMAKGRPMDRIALVSFADKSKVESKFEDTPAHHIKAVNGLKPWGKLTMLYQALLDSLDMFQNLEISKRRRVIVISDGKNEKKKNSRKNVSDDDVISKSTKMPIPIPIDAVGRGDIETKYMKSLSNLANSTFGSFIDAGPRKISPKTALVRIYNDMLETRSLVVYFEYEMVDPKQTTPNATINLKLPGEEPIPVKIPGEIPTPKKQTRIWRYILFSGLFALCIGLFIWIRYIFKEDEKEPGATDQPEKWSAEPPVEVISDTEPPPPDTAVQWPPDVAMPEPHQKGTMVGSYSPADVESVRPAVRLVAISGPAEGQQVDLAGNIINIGADPENDLDLTVDDYVSGQHASIHYEEGDFLIFDKGSRNRTFVNQIEVTDSGVALNIGDHITIGRSVFEVVDLSM